MKAKLFLAIIASLLLTSCNEKAASGDEKNLADTTQVSEDFSETEAVFEPATLVNGIYETACENTGTPSSLTLRSISSKKAFFYVEDSSVTIWYHTYWDIDCQNGTENDWQMVYIDRVTHDFLRTTYESRWDDFYQKCELDTYGYSAGDHAEVDGIGCYLSFEGYDFKIKDANGGGYDINGVVFN